MAARGAACIVALLALLPANYPPVIHRDFYCRMVRGPQLAFAMDRLNERMNMDAKMRPLSRPFNDALIFSGLGDFAPLMEVAKDQSDPDTAFKASQILGSLHDCGLI